MGHHVRVIPGPVARVVRAALFAFVCVGAAAVLHSMAAGSQVSWSSITVGMVPVSMAAYAGLGRERSATALTIGLGVAQVGLHLLFEQVCPPAITPFPATAMPSMPGMSVMGMGTGAASGTSAGSGVEGLITMLAAHTIAILVCGWWLGWGERQYFDLCRAFLLLAATPVRRFRTAVLMLVLAAVMPLWRPPARRRTPTAVLDRRPFPGLLSATLTFRGPPVLA